jgi:hypothetical protein
MSMAEAEKTNVEEFEDLFVVAARIRRERDERLVALRKRLAEEPVEPDPGLKRLVDTQDEFQERVLRRVYRIMALASAEARGRGG